jgi:hypothetical protein
MPRLLVISTVRWGYLWQRHQALATAAAQAGWLVDFLQPRPRNIRQVLSFPFRMVRSTRLEQDHGAPPAGVRILGSTNWLRPLPPYELALVYIPDRVTEQLLGRVPVGQVVYDAVLDWATVPRAWYPPLGWRNSERRIAALPDSLVTTDSAGMAHLLANRGITSSVLPPAADPEFIDAGKSTHAKRPAALFLGSIRDEVDIPALTGIARAGVPVDVIGRIEHPRLRNELESAGVTLREPVPVSRAAELAAAYRVILLPYRGDRSRTLAPAKYWNCVATRSWVVTRGLSALEPAPNVIDSNGPIADLVDHVTTAFETPAPVADVPTWDTRWRELMGMLAHRATEDEPRRTWARRLSRQPEGDA